MIPESSSTYRIVIRYEDHAVRGFAEACDLGSMDQLLRNEPVCPLDSIRLKLADSDKTEDVSTHNAKAVFFVKTFDGETLLFPGLRSIPGYGHTPGQSYYVLESGGEKMIFWGDIIHVPDIQFYNPNITIKFDVDSTAAAARRKRDFADAAKNRELQRVECIGLYWHFVDIVWIFLFPLLYIAR